MLLGNEADTAAYFGQLGKARDLSRRADSSATQSQQRETAALHEAAAAIREALFGNADEARKWAASTKQLRNSRDVLYGASLALGLTDDSSQGEARLEQLADDLAKRFPEDTLVEFNYLPTLRAQIAIDHHDPSKAIEFLQAAAPYELGGHRAVSCFVSHLCTRGGLPFAASGQPSSRRVSKNPRPSRDCVERAHRGTGAPPTRPRLRNGR